VTGTDMSIEQAMPVPNDSPSVQGMVRADLETREKIGVERYGTALQPHNGRDGLRDAYEEVLDLACYLRQAIAERRREDVDAAVAEVHAQLGPELQRKDDLLAEMRRQLKAADQTRDRYVADSRRVPGLETALRSAQDALVMFAQTCRYHGTDFGDTKFGDPPCESCRAPYRVGLALRAVQEGLDSRG
jgi:hypothetical protein